MDSRNTVFAKLCCALFALCLVASACSNKQDAAITQKQVVALVATWDLAQQTNNLESVVACLSKKLQYKTTFKGFGPTETWAGDYHEYVEHTKSGFSAGQSLNSQRTISVVTVNPDGQSASLLFEVHDAMIVKGRLFRTVSSGTMTFGMEEGKAVITSIDEVARPDSGNPQPFQSSFK